jgi:hypothetical protein
MGPGDIQAVEELAAAAAGVDGFRALGEVNWAETPLMAGWSAMPT